MPVSLKKPNQNLVNIATALAVDKFRDICAHECVETEGMLQALHHDNHPELRWSDVVDAFKSVHPAMDGVMFTNQLKGIHS